MQLDRAQKKKLKNGTLFGIELVDSVARLCAMNLLLHGIGGESEADMPLNNGLPVVTKDALAGKHGEYEIVLANPPFGKKSSVTIVNEAGEHVQGIAHHQPRRFLGEHEQQAAQFPPAHLHHPQAARPRGGGVAGQRAL